MYIQEKYAKVMSERKQDYDLHKLLCKVKKDA